MQQNKVSLYVTIVTCISMVVCWTPSVFAQTGSISGRITDANGDPIPNMYVMAFSDPCLRGGELDGSFTDADGSYTIYGVPVGSVYVRTYSGSLSYVDKIWDGNNGSSDCHDAVPVTVTAGAIH